LPRLPGSKSGTLSWLGLAPNADDGGPMQDVELRLEQVDPKQENRLLVTIAFHPPSPAALQNKPWRDRCTRVFCDLRAYLMGSTEIAG
jgi:serine/threonine-protein kinase